jgi:Raf kinase inhibitor-like YbhB/YbcL family protein
MGGTTGGAGSGGASGASAGQGGRGGAGMTGAGAGGKSMAGGAGLGAGGMPGGGMGGQSGSAGGGMSGMSGTGAGMAGKAGGGAGGSTSGAMTLTSTAITEGGMFPAANTCNGGSHVSPDLTWTAGPSGTMSYAVVLLDTDNDLNHWVLWDIPASITSLPAGLDDMAMPAMPAGAKQKAVQGNGYFGPCPNGMDHLYQFTVYAISTATLAGAMTSEATSAIVMDIMSSNPLDSASLSAHSSATMN